MHTSQTPFQLLQKQDKERRLKILNSIERKDLKHRSISYNLNGGDNHQSDSIDKNQARELYSTIAINNSIKKSYYYRKLLNKSIDTHMTADEFQRVKQTFAKMTKQDCNNQNRATFFRELWERELAYKEDRHSTNDRQNYLQVISTNNHEKQKNIQFQQIEQKKKVQFMGKNILDIAEERRASLDFDLEVLGKKKSLRIKDNHSKLRVNRTMTAEKDQKNAQSYKNVQIVNQNNQQSPTKANCSFFKSFQQQNLAPINQSSNNDFLQVSKINHNFFPNNLPKQTHKLKQIRLRYNHSELQRSDKMDIARQIKSCWKVNRISQKPTKIQTAQQRKRPILQKITKPKLCFFTNDIKGWIEGQEHDEELLQDFN